MIITDYIRFNGFSRPGRKLSGVRGIVLHYTGDPGASDVSIRGYFDRLGAQDPNDRVPDRYASAHTVIDLDGSVIEMIPMNEMAYHCGAEKYMPGIAEKLGVLPNTTTLGI
jgi:N-acetylmuramoyl-L-alanine amidase CwlA